MKLMRYLEPKLVQMDVYVSDLLSYDESLSRGVPNAKLFQMEILM
jgi:hypothetical protein